MTNTTPRPIRNTTLLCASLLMLAPLACDAELDESDDGLEESDSEDDTDSEGFAMDEEAAEGILEPSEGASDETVVWLDNTRPFDQYHWLTAHNAFANSDDHWILANQAANIQTQLNYGVRGFMLDVHHHDYNEAICIASFGADCYGSGEYLCHGNCQDVPGFNYALPRKTLSSALTTIKDFLDANPNEVVTVFLESPAVSASALQTALNAVPGIRNLIFDPVDERVKDHGWPTLAEMQEQNKRLLIFTQDENFGAGIRWDHAFFVQNHYDWNDSSCVTRWADMPLTAVDSWSPNFNRLFLMNHFLPIPDALASAFANSTLASRIENHCRPAAGKRPNYVAVDFVDDGVKSVVDGLNGTHPTPATLQTGKMLRRYQSLRSGNGRVQFIFQGDGNLVLYADGIPRWASNTAGLGAQRVIMQTDGNLVMYRSDDIPIWATQTDSPSNADSQLVVQDDGNVVIYNGQNQATWATNTNI